jgi:uncharacterized protein (TIGR03382 family)
MKNEKSFATRALLFVAVAAVVGAFAPVVHAQTLTRGPYVQRGTASEMTVVWRTLLPTTGEVRYGLSPNALEQTANTAGESGQQEVRITGLSPNTVYHYAVFADGTEIAPADGTQFFKTAPQVGKRQRFRMWVAGDSGTANLAQATVRDAMLEWTGADRPEIFLHMGDMAYSDGTELEFGTNFFFPYRDILKNTVCWPTMGNHEGRSSDSATESGPYYDAYVLPRDAEAGGLASGTEAYYSFDYANAHFVILDSHQTPRGVDDAMLTWMVDDLAATDQDWIIAYWHHPAYSKGTHNSDSEGALIDMRENAVPLLEAAGVDLVLAGHSHIYERSYLIDGAYDTPTVAEGFIVDDGDGKVAGAGPYRKGPGNPAHEGAVYVVSGHAAKDTSYSAIHPVMYFVEDKSGSNIIDIAGNTLTLYNVRWDGEITDQFTLIKGGGIDVLAPSEGHVLATDEVVEIQWLAGDFIAQVDIAYSTDGGSTFTDIATGVENNGAHSWTIPNVSTTEAMIQIVQSTTATYQGQSGIFTIDNSGANRAPALSPVGDQVARVDQDFTLQLAASDPDGDALTYSVSGAPAAATLDAATGLFQWMPTEADLGDHALTFTVADAQGADDSQAITLSVLEAEVPAGSGDAGPVGENGGEDSPDSPANEDDEDAAGAGCGCTSQDPSPAFLAFFVAGLFLRRPRRR